MDIKLMLTTFGMVFLAELGDKTQLATFCLSADCGESSKLPVFIGSAGALVLSSFIAVMLGEAVSRFIPPNYIKIAAGIFFVIVGIWMLYSARGTVFTIN
jgi:putative Ca2+/H+ antiporter (TMEM165/GDT1 family)